MRYFLIIDQNLTSGQPNHEYCFNIACLTVLKPTQVFPESRFNLEVQTCTSKLNVKLNVKLSTYLHYSKLELTSCGDTLSMLLKFRSSTDYLSYIEVT